MATYDILVVDDSQYVHKMVRAYLEGDPVLVHSAFDGENGVSQAEKIRPDLILLDIDLPYVGGIDACRRLKASPATEHIPIIFLTADCSIHDKVRAFEMGACDYITKPCRPEELRARVRAALYVSGRLEHASMVDSVTKLWNRAYLNIHLSMQQSLAKRIGLPLACIMAEVDSLAALENEHGPQLMMAALRNIANVFVRQSRTEDIICYLGSGRFVAVDPATSDIGAARHADRLRVEVERQLLQFQTQPLGVTCSFGVAETKAEPAESMLDRAEQELLCAAEGGGNMVCVAKSLAA